MKTIYQESKISNVMEAKQIVINLKNMIKSKTIELQNENDNK